MKIAGATVFRGVEGYGETAELHRSHAVRSDRPIIIAVVDSAENVRLLIPVVADMIDTGLMAKSAVEMIRVEKKTAAHAVTPGVEIVTGVVHGPAAGRFAVSIALPADELRSQTA